MTTKNKLRNLNSCVVCCALAAIIGSTVQSAVSARADDSLFVQRAAAPQDEASRQGQTPISAVRQVTHVEAEPSRLAAPGVDASIPLPGAPHSAGQKTSAGASTLGALFSVTLSLAAVLGLFFLIAWLMRRGLPTTATGRLPVEVVDVLGRAPLAGRQQMHLLRLGNKLLLICMSPSGVHTLGEITDPAETERLAALCRGSLAESNIVAKSLRQVFSSDAGKRSTVIGASAGEAGDV